MSGVGIACAIALVPRDREVRRAAVVCPIGVAALPTANSDDALADAIVRRAEVSMTLLGSTVLGCPKSSLDGSSMCPVGAAAVKAVFEAPVMDEVDTSVLRAVVHNVWRGG